MIRELLWLAIRSSVAFRLCQSEDDAPPPPPPRPQAPHPPQAQPATIT